MTTALQANDPRPVQTEALIRAHIGSLETEAGVNAAMEFYLRMEEFAKVWRGIHAEIKQSLIDWMIEHDRGFTIGDQRIFVARKKSSPKCNDTTAAIEEVALNILQGDEDAAEKLAPFLSAICEHLSSSAVLPGKFKKTLGQEAFDEHFTIKTFDTVAGEPIKELVEVNSRFVK